ncbi:MAG TPA: hypothetical protein VK772_01470 [Puia sp.]|nr:hypothetical protein [Puia sp.]
MALLCICLSTYTICFSQDSSSLADKVFNFPGKFFKKVNEQTNDLDKQLEKQTAKYILRLQKKEERLRKKLYKQDSSKASSLFANNPEQQYQVLLQKLRNDSATVFHSMGPEYLPYADSLQGMLGFLNKNPQLLNSSKVFPADIQNSLTQLQQLQAKMQDADQIKQFMVQRKQQIQQYLSGLTNPPPGVSGIYNDYKKELFYYSDRVRQYRQILNDPDKMMNTALNLLNQVPAFQTFMRKNSFLAALFSIPSNYGEPEGLVGLQTRDQVLAIIQGQLSGGGGSAASMIQTSLQSAQADINNMRNKMNALGGGSGDMTMPDFKPSNQKTKTFLQRLEYGTNLQTQSGSFYFPTTTDLGLSVGYKISDKNEIGIGASYKVGWGKDFQHINVSSQGAGIRSFVDIKAIKSFYLSGGFEYNYQQAVGYLGYPISEWSAWQQSGLVGISKIVSMNTKVFKKTKIQFLWDFLSYQQIPRGQPFKFRVGYSF